jgi:adenylate kinase family enzyme
LSDDSTVKRVSVVGNSGSGKSRLAERIATVLNAPYIELDAIHHLADWKAIDPDLFLARVGEISSRGEWVIDGNYRTVVVEGPVWKRADTVVWLDLPRSTVMYQVVRRTLSRLVRRETLWNGNRERWRNLFAWNPNESIIRWTWTQHRKYSERYSAAMESPALGHLAFVRLTSREAVDLWLGELEAATPS